MAKKLYIGSLAYATTSEDLKKTFSNAGNVVSSDVIIDRINGRSKGFGFVEMSSEEEAKNAIEMFDGKELDGRVIHVSEARPQEPKNNRNFDNHRFNGHNKSYNQRKRQNW